MWVPGGYILLIAMSYCPGSPFGSVDRFRGMGDKEREGIREAFGKAYEHISFFFLC